MSSREVAKNIIDCMPDYKISAIVYFLKGMQYDDELEDQIFCQQMAEEYIKDDSPDKHEFIAIEDLAAELGVTL